MSSFDEGGPEFDLDEIKSQIRVDCEAKALTFERLCALAGVQSDEAKRAYELGANGFPGSLDIFNRLSVAAAKAPLITSEMKVAALLLEPLKLLWKVVYKEGISHQKGNDFKRFFLEYFSIQPQAGTVRYRLKSVPQNLKGMILFYRKYRAQKRD